MKTMEFIEFYFRDFLKIIGTYDYNIESIKLSLMAIIHQNKHNNNVF